MTNSLADIVVKATDGPWRRGADLIRVHTNWRDEEGNCTPENFHRNGFAKTIAAVGKEDGDWRGIEQQVADAQLIALAPTLATLVLEAREALFDARSGWRYIRAYHGELSGVGWDRVEDKLSATLAKLESL